MADNHNVNNQIAEVVEADDDLADCSPEERAEIMADRARREEFFQAHQPAFENGTLTTAEVGQLPEARAQEYLERELKKKYQKDDVPFSCNHCATVALFNDPSPDGPYITDDELIDLLGFEHM